MRNIIASAVTILALLADPTRAQYGGFIFATSYGTCPRTVQLERNFLFKYKQTPDLSCYDIRRICPNGTCSIAITANAVGVKEWPPSRIGACRDCKCTDCRYNYVELPDSYMNPNWKVTCMKFWEEGWLTLVE